MIKAFNNLRIGTKLSLIFGCLLLANLGASGFSINRMEAIKATETDMAANWLPMTRLLGDMSVTMKDHRITMFRHASIADRNAGPTLEKRMKDLKDKFIAAEKEYEVTITSEK